VREKVREREREKERERERERGVIKYIFTCTGFRDPNSNM
jgi:hypothetical protein